MASMKKIFEFFFSIISLWELMSPRGLANLYPRGMVGRIYEGHHLTLLNTKYLSSGPHSFREDFISFSHYKSVRANEPRAWPVWTPGAWLAGFM